MRNASGHLPEKMLAPYRGTETAIVTMFLSEGDLTFTSSGKLNQNGETAPENMIFEIGSITKVFTALLLAVLIEEGRIDPNRPVKDMTDSLSDTPAWITPQTLATHTSGLPIMHLPVWKVLLRPQPEDPYATFSRSDLIGWLSARKKAAPPLRIQHAYSNLAYGLLGEAMAMREGKPFVELLKEKVIAPLGLIDTTSDLTISQQARFMQPFNTKDKPVLPWTFEAIAGAGCLRSTARDLGRFSDRVIKALADPKSSLDRAIEQSVAPLFGLGPCGAKEPVAQCLGWLSIKVNADAVILSNRGIAGNLWSSAKLRRSDPDRTINDLFANFEQRVRCTLCA